MKVSILNVEKYDILYSLDLSTPIKDAYTY